jgi:hypothetical protein
VIVGRPIGIEPSLPPARPRYRVEAQRAMLARRPGPVAILLAMAGGRGGAARASDQGGRAGLGIVVTLEQGGRQSVAKARIC